MSFEVNIDTTMLENVVKGLSKVQIEINKLTLEELVIIGERTLELARNRIPFQTGAARDSLQMFVDSTTNTVTIGSDGGIRPKGNKQIYLRYLELGTSKMTAKPFLFPALTQAIDEFKARFPLKIEEMTRINIYGF